MFYFIWFSLPDPILSLLKLFLLPLIIQLAFIREKIDVESNPEIFMGTKKDKDIFSLKLRFSADFGVLILESITNILRQVKEMGCIRSWKTYQNHFALIYFKLDPVS